MWLQKQIKARKDGEDQWRRFIVELNTPPVVHDDPVVGRRVLSQAEQIRAAAEAAVGHEGAAFAASL